MQKSMRRIDALGRILQLVCLKIPKSPTLRDLEIQEEEGSILNKLDEEVMETIKGILKDIVNPKVRKQWERSSSTSTLRVPPPKF